MAGATRGTRLEVRRSGAGVWVHGEIDLSNTPVFQRALAGGADGEPALLDLTGVDFMDSSALAVLLTAATDAEPGRPLVVRPSAFVGRLLRLTGIDRHEGIVVDAGPHSPDGDEDRTA
jgi:anti-anti-sigma factor